MDRSRLIEILRREGSLTKMRRAAMRELRWASEDWYLAWQTTGLPDEVTAAAEDHRRRREASPT